MGKSSAESTQTDQRGTDAGTRSRKRKRKPSANNLHRALKRCRVDSPEPVSSPEQHLDERPAELAQVNDHCKRKRKVPETSPNLQPALKRRPLQEEEKKSRKRKRVDDRSGPAQKRMRDQSPVQLDYISISSDPATDSHEDMGDEASDVSNEPAIDIPPTSPRKGGQSDCPNGSDMTRSDVDVGSEESRGMLIRY